MRDALVADLAFTDLEGTDEPWTNQPNQDERDWTRNLARQLGIDVVREGEVHEILNFLLPFLDAFLRDWPPQIEISEYEKLVHAAISGMEPIALYGILLAGPAKWQSRKLDATSVARLPDRLQDLLEHALASELRRVVDQWVKWDIRDLAKRRREMREAKRAEERAAAPPRPRLTAQERQDLLRRRSFTPKGKTF